MSEPFNYEQWLEKQPGKAYELVRRVEKFWLQVSKGRKEGYEVALYVATSFGVHRVTTVFAQGADVILMSVVGGEISDTILAPPEQCAFMIQHFLPTTEKPKVIVGFKPSRENEQPVQQITAGNAGWPVQFRFAVHAGWSRVPELWTLCTS